MSFSSSSISRTPPSAERSTQRAERPPAGDFAALLDLAPTPARGARARVAERHGADSGAGGGHGDRRERLASASPRSRHSGTDGDRSAAASGQVTPRPDSSQGHNPAGATAADGAVSRTPADGTSVSASPDGTSPVDGAADVAAAALAAASPAAPAPSEPLAGLVMSVPSPLPATPALAPAGPPAGAAVLAAAADGVALPVPSLTGAPPLGELPSADAQAGTAVPVPPAPVGGGLEGAVFAEGAGAVHGAVPTAEPAAPAGGGAAAARFDAEGGSVAGAEPATATPAEGAGSPGARDGQAGRGASAEVSDAPSAASAPTAAPASLSGSTRLPDAAAFGPHRSVPLERAPRAVAQLLHVASQQGVSHARIALRPVELGGIEIFLQASPAGLSAQLIAESPEAARMLAQASEDLRRSLANQNVELVSLEVSTSAEQQQRDDLGSRGFVADDDMPGGRPSPRRGDAGSEPDVTTPDLTTPIVIELPDGLLVDVLA